MKLSYILKHYFKFYGYLFLNAYHPPWQKAVVKLLLRGYLGLLFIPSSISRVLYADLESDQWKLLLRRMIWLFHSTLPSMGSLSDSFFDFSIGLDTKAARDSYDLVSRRSKKLNFYTEIRLAQLSGQIMQSQVSRGEALNVNELQFSQFDTLFLQHIASAEKMVVANQESQPADGSGSVTQKNTPKLQKPRKYTNYLALHGTSALSRALGNFASTNTEVFATSGTFLGIVRDNGFLAHDYDVDLGVFSETYDSSIIDKFSSDEEFREPELDFPCLRKIVGGEILYTRSSIPHLVRLCHKNGIQIDLFTYFLVDDNAVEHGGSLHRWRNSLFELSEYELYDEAILGPKDYNRYLCESYGEWRVPSYGYNCSTHSNNLVYGDSPSLLCLMLNRGYSMVD